VRDAFSLTDVAAAVRGRARGSATLTGVGTLDSAGPSDLSWVVDERREVRDRRRPRALGTFPRIDAFDAES